MIKTIDDLIKDGEDFLQHHGIKGQKWGVRNGPPYPLGADFKLRKGKKLYRASNSKDDTTDGKHLYMTYNKTDRNFYKKFIGAGKEKTYEHKYKSNKQLNMAGGDTVMNQLKNMSKNKKLLKEADEVNANYQFKNRSGLKTHELADAKKGYKLFQQYQKGKITINSLNDSDYNKLVLGSYYDAGKRAVDKYFDMVKNKQISESDRLALSIGGHKKARDILFNELTRRGYDGMLDVAGVGVVRDTNGKATREGVSPIILFDKKDVNKKSEKEISKWDQDMAYDEYRRKIKKYKNPDW